MSAFWLRAVDENGRCAILDCPEALAEWRPAPNYRFQLEIWNGERHLATAECYDDSAESIIEEVVTRHFHRPFDDTLSHPGEVICLRDLYTKGECDVFAVALREIIGGDLEAVTDNQDDRGRKARLPALVHAGVYLDGRVYDIDGSLEASEWSMRWHENGGVVDGACGPISRKRLQKIQRTVHTATEIERATSVAWLIAALTGRLDAKQLATYHALQHPTKLAA